MHQRKKDYVLIIDPCMATPETQVYNAISRHLGSLSENSECNLSGLQFYLPNYSAQPLRDSIDFSQIAGVICLGSLANVSDKYPWLKTLQLDLEQKVFEKGLPFLGICFGHQFVSHAFGGSVGYIKNRHKLRFGRYHAPRVTQLTHLKLRSLFCRMHSDDYFLGNKNDLLFQEVLAKTIEWTAEQWAALATFPQWKLNAQETRIHRHITENSCNAFKSYARHEQEVHVVPAASLISAATSEQCSIDAAVHRNLPIFTFQTHPETPCSLLRDGELLLKNFLYLCHFYSERERRSL